MDIQERLNTVMQVVQESNLVDEVEPQEILQIADEIGEKDYKKIVQTVTYIRKRFVENKSRYESFKSAFPERCIVKDNSEVEKWGGSKNIGDELGRTTIEVKAKRLESSRLYKYIVTMLHTSLHIAFALERYKVLEYNLKKIFDENVKDRDKVEYMKVFLQETRKPEKTSEFELNVNIQQNNVSVVQVEDRLRDIANKLNGMDADSIISIVGERNGNE